MKRIFATLLLATLLTSARAQKTIPVYQASATYTLDLSAKRQQNIKRRDLILSKKNISPKERKELDVLLAKNDETVTDIWSIGGAECSWYCGGGNYAIKASSSLKDHNPKRANDLSYQTAWVEGKDGDGRGEYIEYYFKNNSPRITSVIITNGYVKTETTWKNNNRVKKLKVYVNGKPYGILNLADLRGDHVFELGTLGRNKDGTDLIVRFEITEVYNGIKYNDTAITEIYFDGIDVH